MRIIITGSRIYPDRDIVTHELDRVYDGLGERELPLTVVHGGCPTGADLFAHEWCESHPEEVTELVYRADWEKHGKAAGPLRNQQMVAGGAALVLAFPLAGERKLSRGTWNTVQRAWMAGLEVEVYPA